MGFSDKYWVSVICIIEKELEDTELTSDAFVGITISINGLV